MLEKICNILLSIILIIIVAVAGILVVPRAMGMIPYGVLSGSMEPVYHVGSIVFVKPTPPEEIKTGDAITYTLPGQGGMVVTHRVVSVDPVAKAFVTKGDANDVVDIAPIAFDRLVGKVIFNVPYLGFLTFYMKSKMGILFGCGLLIVMVILNVLPKLFAKEKSESQ